MREDNGSLLINNKLFLYSILIDLFPSRSYIGSFFKEVFSLFINKRDLFKFKIGTEGKVPKQRISQLDAAK